jgi:hypothetical protein
VKRRSQRQRWRCDGGCSSNSGSPSQTIACLL